MIEIKEVLRLWTRGHGLRTIATRVGPDRKTVRRYIQAAEHAGLKLGMEVDDDTLAAVVLAVRPGGSAEVGPMREHLRAHSALIQGWVAQGCQGPKLVKLLRQQTQVCVPLRTMQRFLADDLGVTSVHDTVRIVDPPAGVLEIDFLTLGTFREIGSGEERTMDALLCLAAKSRHQFVWPCLGQTLEDVLAGLEAAWDFFGGVFPVLIPDNLKAIVQKADAVNPTFNTTFLEYAQARGFEIDPARTGKPKDKARVERQVRYVRGDFFAGEDFRSVEAARIEAVRWAREDAGMRTHGTTRRQPIVAFEEQDKPALHPAPTEPYDVPRWSTHTVRRDHAVVVQRALYSVPYHLGRCVLRSRTTQSTVKLYLGPTLVKTHLRQPDGGTQIDPDDLPPEKAALATRDPSSLHEQAMRHGPHVGEYAKRLTDGPLPWSRLRFVYRLLGLARRFGSAATEEACARALEVDVVNIMTVERMLEKGLRRRGLLTASSPSMPSSGVVLRFARPKDAFRTGEPDATA